MHVKTILTVAALATLLAVSTSRGEELPEPKMYVITKGLLCNTQEEVEQTLTQISLSGGKWPDDLAEGCGFMGGQLPVLITPLGWYETPLARSLIAVYEAPGFKQYGFVAYEINEDYEAADQDT